MDINYDNLKIQSVQVLREWVIKETEFQTKALETVQELSRKHDTRSNTGEMPHNFFVSKIRVLDQTHQRNL